jgi:hypothetical protein
MNWLKEILEDNSGGTSSSRVLMLVWGIGVFAVWCYASIHTGGIVPIPESVITVLLGTTAIKAVQRFGEKSEPPKE